MAKKNQWRNWNLLKIQDYPKAHLEWKKGKAQHNGFVPPVFDFNSNHFQKEFVEVFLAQMKSYGFNSSETEAILSKRINMKPLLFRRMVFGRRGVMLWEIPLLLEIAGLKLNIKKIKDRFSYHSEGTNNELLVIKCKIPKFKAVFNKNDLYDFDVFFNEDKYILHCVSKRDKKARAGKYFSIFKQMLSWYFLKKRGKKQYPFSIYRIHALFLDKYEKNETKHMHGNSKPENRPSITDEDEEEDMERFIEDDEEYYNIYKDEQEDEDAAQFDAGEDE